MAAIVVAPRPILRVGSGFVLPLQRVHGWVANPHGHLGHQMIAVVKREAKQSTLLWCCEESEQTAQGIAKTVKTEIGPACPDVADEIAAAVLKPILQPIRDHLGLHIEFVLVLIVSVLLRGSSP